jgi:tetratricopeptide (TPR) repeat protein
MSQAQLAFPELSDSYISLIESDKRVPAPSVLDMLARKLGCSATYLASGLSDDAVNELNMAIEYAEIALQNGEAVEAGKRFAEVIANPDIAALSDLARRARWGYARALESSGQLEKAINELRVLVTEESPERDHGRWAELHKVLTRCLRERGELTESIHTGEAGARALTRVAADMTDSAIELEVTVLGSYVYRGDLVRAQQLADQLICRAQQVGTTRALMAAYWQAALVAQHQGRFDDGISLAERALALLGEDDDERNLSRLRGFIAMLLLRGAPENAERARSLLLKVKDDMSANVSSETDMALILVELARAETSLARLTTAVGYAEQAIEMLGDPPRWVIGWSLAALGEAYMRMGRRDEAVDVLTRAATCLEGMESTREAAQVWTELAELFGEVGDEERQCVAYRRALACVGIGRS